MNVPIEGTIPEQPNLMSSVPNAFSELLLERNRVDEALNFHIWIYQRYVN